MFFSLPASTGTLARLGPPSPRKPNVRGGRRQANMLPALRASVRSVESFVALANFQLAARPEKMLRFVTAGESHGQALLAWISGLPAGLVVEHEFCQRELHRRQLGYGRGR